MIDFVIRPVRPEDLDMVTEVEAVCFPPAEAAPRKSFEQRIAAFPECFFVAMHGDQMIGFINGCATDEMTIRDEMFADSSLHKPDGCYQSIFGLAVIPEYQRQGIGRAFFRIARILVAERGYKEFFLSVNRRNYEAQRFYLAMGGEVLCEDGEQVRIGYRI